MKENFLISTGGSGGHVIPAIVLHEHLSQKNNIIISTDKRGLKYLDKDTFMLEIINTPKLNNIFFLPFNFLSILILTFRSLFLLKRKKIKKFISTGGYMSLPLILAAKIMRLDIYLIEPNQILGRANKLFLSSCKNIFCYSNNIKNFPNTYEKKKVIINPLVKKKIYDLKSLSTKEKKFTLLIVGGSQGAGIFDDKLKDFIVKISEETSIRIIQQTNDNNILSLSQFYSKYNIENRIFSFEKNLSNFIQEADLCITRAGASTLAELSILNTPFIAVPLPSAKDNHQFENAKYYENNGCCWIINQNLFNEKIEKILKNILSNKSDYLNKIENLKKLNYQNTWINVNQKLLKFIYEN